MVDGHSNSLYLIAKGEVELFYDFKRNDMEHETSIQTIKVG